jgi:DNA-binding PadR family transcriptional regulator
MHTPNFEHKCMLILNDCRSPRTLHYVKDKYNFNNKQVIYALEYLQFSGFITISTVPRDGRGTKAISTTDKGKEMLTAMGLKY